jgi:hypothetical protein
MNNHDNERRDFAKRLLGPIGPELSCEHCIELLDQCVELELAGIDAGALLPALRNHLDGCRACREDHASLRALVGPRHQRRADLSSPDRLRLTDRRVDRGRGLDEVNTELARDELSKRFRPDPGKTTASGDAKSNTAQGTQPKGQQPEEMHTMHCYPCAEQGVARPAVAICRSCSAGLCLEHLRETAAQFAAGNMYEYCHHDTWDESKAVAAETI